MLHARIAGITMSLQGGDREFFEKRLQEYGIPAPPTVDLAVRVERVEQIAVPAGNEVLKRGGISVLDLPDGRFAVLTISKKTGRALQCTVFARDYSAVDITLLKDRRTPDMTDTDWEYVYTGLVFADRLAYLGGLVMHGSAIAYDGKGVVFSAPSGTGKSTHAGLWAKRFGEKVISVNDDKPAIRFDGEQPFLYGTPWSGKTDSNHNVFVPLQAIVFLERAEENRIRRLTPTEAMLHLGNETIRPFYDVQQGLRVLERAEKLIQTVPMYLLGCTISEEAVELVKQELQW